MGAAWASNEWEMCVKLDDNTSIFHAELYAIFMAMEFLIERGYSKALICTDSLSGIKAIEKIKCFDPLVVKIRNLINAGKTKFVLMWIPAHVGLEGNERADELAKKGAKEGETREIGLIHGDIKKLIKRETLKIFQSDWDAEKSKQKLGMVKDSVKPWKTSHLLVKKDEVVITRLRLGHTRLTHEHIFDRGVRERCVCGVELSVEHIFSCRNYADVRYKFSIRGIDTLKCDDVESQQNVIKYIKAIRYYSRI